MTRRIPFLSLVIATVGVVFLLLQLMRPELKNPPVTAELQAPPDVKHILKNSCYNCHSNETQMPWFDKIVPAYWLVTRDVNMARKHLNFSEIGTKQALTKVILYQSVYEIQLGKMPPPSYKLLHPRAVITPEQLAILRAYATQDTAAAKDRRPRHGS
jgi:Haem-binding domain